jgi:hypothetical protein
LPDIGEMPGPAARDDEQGIDADIVAGSHVALRKPFGGNGDASKPPIVERECRRFEARTLLDFDEGQDPAAASDNVNLAPLDARSPRENPPAVEAQIPASEGFGAATAPLGRMAVHRANSSARA